MTATEELRRLLDEADEYYKTSGNRTWWGRPIDMQTGKPINVFHYQAQPMGDDRLFVELQLATPEQAIAATLGRGECRDDNSRFNAWSCSECEATLLLMFDDYGEPSYSVDGVADVPKYCPNCGRKVVDE